MATQHDEIEYARAMLAMLRERLRDPRLSTDDYFFDRYLMARMIALVRGKEAHDDLSRAPAGTQATTRAIPSAPLPFMWGDVGAR
jgi:hypothetical protein